jgi:hypothetical protein
MRSGRRGFVLLVLTLVLAGAVRNAPEISRLTNNYSNDGVPVSSELLVPGVTSCRLMKHESLRPSASRSLAPVDLRARSTLVPIFVLTTAAGQGRLHFLSLQLE